MKNLLSIFTPLLLNFGATLLLLGSSLFNIALANNSAEKVLNPIISIILDEKNCVGEIDELLSLEFGDELEVTCDYDLKSIELSLPSNVSLVENSGSIINGHLTFGTNRKIDGKLLNYTLNIGGNASLLNDNFIFDQNKWGVY